jgi:hypothetical protein
MILSGYGCWDTDKEDPLSSERHVSPLNSHKATDEK